MYLLQKEMATPPSLELVTETVPALETQTMPEVTFPNFAIKAEEHRMMAPELIIVPDKVDRINKRKQLESYSQRYMIFL